MNHNIIAVNYGKILFVAPIHIFAIAVKKTVRPGVNAVGAHKVRKLKSDGFGHAGSLRGTQFVIHFFPLDRQEFYGHITVKTFAVCPALHVVLSCQIVVYYQKLCQFIIFAESVLKRQDINGTTES